MTVRLEKRDMCVEESNSTHKGRGELLTVDKVRYINFILLREKRSGLGINWRSAPL